jgi:hypothetical protein
MCTEKSANHAHTLATTRAALRYDLFGAGMESRQRVSDEDRPPALRTNHDKFDLADDEWELLNPPDVRSRIAPNLLAVGRIHQDLVTLGTAFLVTEDLALTNRHVAESFTTNIDGTRKIRPGWEPAIDFLAVLPPPEDPAAHDHGDGDPAVETAATEHAPVRREPTGDAMTDHAAFHTGSSACFRIGSVLYVDEEIDLALVRVEFEPAAGTQLSKPPGFWRRPKPLKLSLTPPHAARTPLYVIGCPDHDDTATSGELSIVFQDTFDVKRLQPGHLSAIVMTHDDRVEIDHDCSTLRGNSGSCVVSLESHQVIGLHVRGSREGPGETAYNQAIGLWLLPEKTRLMMEAAGVVFARAEESPDPVGVEAS